MTLLAQHLKEPVEHLRTILSESAKFQEITGAADAAAALVFTHAGYAEDKNGDTTAQAAKGYPRAIVAHEDFSSVGQGATWKTTIKLTVRFQAYSLDADRDKSLSDQYLTWLETVGGIIDNVKAAGRSKLMINRIDISIPPLIQDQEGNTNTQKRLWLAQVDIGVGT